MFKTKYVSLAVVAGLTVATASMAETVRYSPADSNQLKTLFAGETSDTVEFRRGDQLKVALRVEGDLLQTKADAMTTLEVKRDFFLRSDGTNGVMISFDGKIFQAFRKAIYRQIDVNSLGGATASGLDVLFAAYVKE